MGFNYTFQPQTASLDARHKTHSQQHLWLLHRSSVSRTYRCSRLLHLLPVHSGEFHHPFEKEFEEMARKHYRLQRDLPYRLELSSKHWSRTSQYWDTYSFRGKSVSCLETEEVGFFCYPPLIWFIFDGI